MKKLVLISLLILLAQLKNYAQEYPTPYGGVSVEDIKLGRYDKDPDAEAVVIYDMGEAFFFDTDYGYDIRFTRTKRVKVFTNAGIKYATVSIPFYYESNRSEIVQSVEAFSYNFENGRITKKTLDPKTIYTEVVNERWKVKKFVIPDVKEGTIFEYRYVIETPFHFNLPDWEFQGPIPTVFSKYVANMIPFYEYTFIVQGTNKLDIQTSHEGAATRTSSALPSNPYGSNGFRDMVYTFGMKDVPAFKDESYISSPNDYIMKLDFQLSKFRSPRTGTVDIMTTWPKLIEDLLKNEFFGAYLRKCRKYAEEALTKLPVPLPENNEEKCRLVIEYVKDNLKWNGRYGKFALNSPKDLLTERAGSSAEINLFLIAMLEAAGLQTHPVIISTRDNGKIRVNYPFENFFNYVMAAVFIDKKVILADATEPLLAYNSIPPRCINEKGLLIKKEEVSWVNLSEGKLSMDIRDITLEIDPDQLTADASITIKASDFDAYVYRSSYDNDSAKIAEEITKKGVGKITRVTTENYDDPSSQYIIKINGITDIESIDRQIIITPFLHFPMNKNPLTQNTRTYPVDMIYASSNLFKSTVKIPEGFKVSSLPETFFMDNELMTISLNYEEKDNSVVGFGNYTFKKAIYKATEYSRIRFYINDVVQKFNQQIIFEPV